MSCILTSENHINSIIHFMRNNREIIAMIGSDSKSESELFEDLRIKMMSVNLRAFLTNYSHRSDVLAASYDVNNKTYQEINAFQFIKLCKSYLYQAIDIGEAYDLKFVEGKLNTAISCALDSIEDYQKAQWTI
ncbi:MAG: hypothetical protein H7836_04555 [Magnetococcus sp. YQC-3]